MLRDAMNEIRLHPGRFVATLLAIAISVGFISAIMIGVRTEENSMTRSGVIAVSKSDVVVNAVEEPADPDEVLKVIQGAAGVTKAEASLSGTLPLKHENFSIYSNAMVLPSSEFRWASLAEGQWPSAEREIVLAKKGAEKLHVKVGDEITAGFTEDEQSASYRVVGLSDDAPSLYTENSYITTFGATRKPSTWIVKSQDPKAAVASIQQALTPLGADRFKVSTTDDYRVDQMKQLTGGFDVFRNLLLGFAAISAVVGMIIIANTFTILVTQRRRQIGLLRAVGASTGQVTGRLFAEAVLLGLVGSLLGVGIGAGVAAVVGIWSGAIYWGLVLPFGELGIAVLVGVLITVLSMAGPSIAATRVSPLEALQVVPSASRVKRLGITRGVFCCLFLLLGGGMVFQAFGDPARGLLWAIGGGGFIPARMLRCFLEIPIYAVTTAYYDSDNEGQVTEEIKKVQWLDPVPEVLEGKNVLVVDEVDDSRVTMEFCLNEFLKEKFNTVGVAVLHEKIKAKTGKIPDGIPYFSGLTVEDLWINYPWDAENIDEHNRLAAESKR